MLFTKRTILTALAISAAASFLLCGYEFIRAVSTSLFIKAYGAHNLPRVMVAIPPAVLLLLYIYGRILSWLGAKRALLLTSLLSAVLIGGSFGLLINGYALAAAFIYVFREAYIVLIIEQYWSLVNSTFSAEQARRINGPFCGLASLGSIAGGLFVAQWAERLGSETFLIFTAASLLPATACAVLAYTFAGEPEPTKIKERGKFGHLGIGSVFHSSHLVLIFLLIITTQVISTVLDLRFNGLVEIAIPEKDARTAYFGNFYAKLGIAASILQFIAVPLVLRVVPLRIVHLSIPAVHLVFCGLLTFAPSLRSGATAYLLFKAFDYSIFRAGKELFYIPLSFDERYRAKQVIDTFGYRFAKGGSAGIIALIGLVVTVPGIAFSTTAMIMAVAWGIIASHLTVRFQRLRTHSTELK